MNVIPVDLRALDTLGKVAVVAIATLSILILAAFFLWELLISSLKVALSGVSPLPYSTPGIVRAHLIGRTAYQAKTPLWKPTIIAIKAQAMKSWGVYGLFRR